LLQESDLTAQRRSVGVPQESFTNSITALPLKLGQRVSIPMSLPHLVAYNISANNRCEGAVFIYTSWHIVISTSEMLVFGGRCRASTRTEDGGQQLFVFWKVREQTTQRGEPRSAIAIGGVELRLVPGAADTIPSAARYLDVAEQHAIVILPQSEQMWMTMGLLFTGWLSFSRHRWQRPSLVNHRWPQALHQHVPLKARKSSGFDKA